MCLFNEPVNTTRVLTRNFGVFLLMDRLLWIGKSKSNTSVCVSDCRTNLEIKNVDRECSAYGRRQTLHLSVIEGPGVHSDCTVERCFSQDFLCLSKTAISIGRPSILGMSSRATQLLHILIPTSLISLCQKGQFAVQPCSRRWFVRKIFGYYPRKIKIENNIYRNVCLSNKRFLGTVCPKDRLDRSWLIP